MAGDEATDRAAAIVGAELRWSEEQTRREIAAVTAYVQRAFQDSAAR